MMKKKSYFPEDYSKTDASYASKGPVFNHKNFPVTFHDWKHITCYSKTQAN